MIRGLQKGDDGASVAVVRFGRGVIAVGCVGNGWMGIDDGYALIGDRRRIGATWIFALIPIDAIS